MSIDQAKIDNWFQHHPLTKEQTVAIDAIRDSARMMAQTIIANSPSSADQASAIRKLREVVMIAQCSISCSGR